MQREARREAEAEAEAERQRGREGESCRVEVHVFGSMRV